MVSTSGTSSPISPPVTPENSTSMFCNSSTATKVMRPKYGPFSFSAGTASTMPPTMAARPPAIRQAQIGQC